MKVLVTGAAGFVGHHLCQWLSDHGVDVVGMARRPGQLEGIRELVVEDLCEDGLVESYFDGVDSVVHLAARVHVMQDRAQNPLDENRRINTMATRRLASAAAAAGVSRFVFLSTVKVLGESSGATPFTSDTAAAPSDPYALSKLEAELALAEVAAQYNMDTTVLRVPLVYGPRVGGNVLRAFELVDRGVPLPFGMLRNKRSMLAVSNLCDVINRVLRHPAAAGQTFLVADGEDLSTADFFEMISRSINKPVRLLPMPEFILRMVGAVFRQSDVIERLTGNLQINTLEIRSLLDWTPVISASDEMLRTGQWFLRQHEKIH